MASPACCSILRELLLNWTGFINSWPPKHRLYCLFWTWRSNLFQIAQLFSFLSFFFFYSFLESLKCAVFKMQFCSKITSVIFQQKTPIQYIFLLICKRHFLRCLVSIKSLTAFVISVKMTAETYFYE